MQLILHINLLVLHLHCKTLQDGSWYLWARETVSTFDHRFMVTAVAARVEPQFMGAFLDDRFTLRAEEEGSAVLVGSIGYH